MLNDLFEELRKKIIGKDEVIRRIIIAILCEGHILIEDVPGVGKTTMAKSIAKSLDVGFSRIQFTPDLMPSDVIGYSIYNSDIKKMEFVKGPIHSHIVLADEVNRTSPKTQSSLLEAMEERQITVDGTTYYLEPPFFVIATQNPYEYEGTFPLPEAQMDRFLMRLSIGYPDSIEDELEILSSKEKHETIKTIIRKEDILRLSNEVKKVYVEESVLNYIAQIVRTTREDQRILLGASPRGTIALANVAKAEAFLNGRSFVIPEDIIKHFYQVISHRIIIKPETRYKGVSHEDILRSIIEKIPFSKKN